MFQKNVKSISTWKNWYKLLESWVVIGCQQISTILLLMFCIAMFYATGPSTHNTTYQTIWGGGGVRKKKLSTFYLTQNNSKYDNIQPWKYFDMKENRLTDIGTGFIHIIS